MTVPVPVCVEEDEQPPRNPWNALLISVTLHWLSSKYTCLPPLDATHVNAAANVVDVVVGVVSVDVAFITLSHPTPYLHLFVALEIEIVCPMVRSCIQQI